jgi:hypothetical protein
VLGETDLVAAERSLRQVSDFERLATGVSGCRERMGYLEGAAHEFSL